ncbi:DUF5367 family protein [Psychroserpens sp.]|uniref:DUF5367 family protein n=1 Tax=Psychroserpens sp. TaxID=2020870 RepID=UPI001B2B69DC|nr:DUF5367 family protein [Psychroserpens sp.]MBO6607195.1 DUF5367 family protein [Psychroserpens sp.]MBO6630775.1 DUF5367 family protein [Psychroserpens sp.]MBO6654341.1 DUF5367 family protein [Psychroserpens sp.]MBO6682373.1 DUF5367 family protein [Psychroserpens sp.]MBO6750967.1 DUF5367 family protein [Psychroserpens sp.]
MKTFKAILIGIGIWFLAVSFYTLSFQIELLADPEQQANFVLLAVLLPLVWYGAHLYFRMEQNTQSFLPGLIFFVVAGILDALITVPLFIIPNGGSHLDFFTDLGFWFIGLVMILTTVLYYYLKVHPKVKLLKHN